MVVRIYPKDVSVLARHSCSAAVASRLTLLGSPAGKNAHFRLRQQARALGSMALRLCDLPGATTDRTHARSVHAVFAPCAPQARVWCKGRRNRGCIPGHWRTRYWVSLETALDPGWRGA